MSLRQRGLAGALVAAAAFLSLPATAMAQVALPPIEHFTKRPAIDDIVVSPSGGRLAVIVFGASGFHQVGVMNLDPVGETRLLTSFDDADVSNVRWVNDDRLVFDVRPRAAEVQEGGAGTFAINHDGSDSRFLIAWSRAPERAFSNLKNRVLPYGWFLHSTVDDGGDDVFVYRRDTDHRDDLRAIELARLNTRTGALRTLSHGMPAGTRTWLLDAKYEPRVLTAYSEGAAKFIGAGKVKRQSGLKWPTSILSPPPA